MTRESRDADASPTRETPAQGEGIVEQGKDHGTGNKERGIAARLARPAAALLELPEGVNPQAWSDWHEYRSTHGQKKIRDAWKNQLSQTKAAILLTKYDLKTQQGMVDLAIANGWQGLQEPRGPSKGERFDPQSRVGSFLTDDDRTLHRACKEN